MQRALAGVAAATASSSFLYTKFFAVGLFRLLELAGAKDPKTLGGLVTSLGVPQERVNADLLTYKGVLSKLAAAKEIMKVRPGGRGRRRAGGVLLGRLPGGQRELGGGLRPAKAASAPADGTR